MTIRAASLASSSGWSSSASRGWASGYSMRSSTLGCMASAASMISLDSLFLAFLFSMACFLACLLSPPIKIMPMKRTAPTATTHHMAELHVHFILGGALALFLGIVVFLIAVLDNPYRGDVSVRPEPFQEISDTVMTPEGTPALKSR